MKTLKTLTLSLAVVAAFAGTASAQTVVKVAGATAFRTPTSAAIIDYLATAGGAHNVYAGDVGGLLAGSSQIFANGTIGSGGTASTIVETYWTGSLAGVVDIALPHSSSGSKYIDPATMGAASIAAVNASVPVDVAAHTGGVAITPTFSNGSPDLAISNAVNTTIKTELLGGASTLTGPVGTATNIIQVANAVTAANIVDAGVTAGPIGTVGVGGFEWVVGNIQTASDIPTNIDQQTARSLIFYGSVAQSQLTGLVRPADSANYFYFTGYNEDSGTRIEYLAESQTGVQAPLTQYAINSATAPNAANPVTNAFEFPITPLNTEPNIVWNTVGHSGYASGATVATSLESAESNTPFAFSDGSQALGNTGAS